MSLTNFSFDNIAHMDAVGDFDVDFNIFSDYLLNEDETPQYNHSHIAFPASVGITSPEYEDDDDMDEDQEIVHFEPGKGKGQVDKRRERNKLLARKTRLRKKFFFDSLQTQVQQLAHENELLKKVIRERFPETMASKVLTTCKTIDISAHFSSPSGSETTSSATSTPPATLESMDFKLIKAIQAAQRSFVITDPSLPDNPIIFASQGFLELTGYMVDDILGRNCRFLQGPKTDQKMVQTLRAGIIRGVDTSVCLLNYRANGEEFYNQVFLAALRDQSDQIINYVGVQVEISKEEFDRANGGIEDEVGRKEEMPQPPSLPLIRSSLPTRTAISAYPPSNPYPTTNHASHTSTVPAVHTPSHTHTQTTTATGTATGTGMTGMMTTGTHPHTNHGQGGHGQGGNSSFSCSTSVSSLTTHSTNTSEKSNMHHQ